MGNNTVVHGLSFGLGTIMENTPGFAQNKIYGGGAGNFYDQLF
jgi:hypothetical protein